MLRLATSLVLALALIGCSSRGPGPGMPAPDPVPSGESEGDGEAALRVTAIEPATGAGGGGQIVAIRGDGFTSVERAVKVYFGEQPGVVVRFAGDGELVVQAPGGTPGDVVDVLVVFEPGGELRLPRAFTFE